MLRTRLIRFLLPALAASLIAAGCTQPTRPGVVTPLPTWEAPNPVAPAFPYGPADGPKLLDALKAKLVDQSFLDSLDPDRRDEIVLGIQKLLADPTAGDQATAFIAGELAAQESYRATGKLPTPLSPAEQAAGGAPQDLIDGKPDDPPVQPPVDPPAPPEPAGSTAVNVTGPDLPEHVGPATSLSVTPTGESFPGGTPTSWPVAGGERVDALGDALRSGGPPQDPEPAQTVCNSSNTGPRHVPATPIPSFQSEMFTPPQDSWLSRDHTGYTPVPRDANDPTSAPILRYNTSINQWQIKVEAHLLSPTLDPFGQYYAIGAFRGLIHVEQLGQPTRDYLSSNPDVEWHTYCYLDDVGLTASRGYVEAWIPIGRWNSTTDPLKTDPGFQIRFETIDNNTNPSVFYAASQHTVHVGNSKAHDATISRGAAAVHVDDGVIVDRDNNPNNDLESVLTTRVVSTLETAFNSLQGQGVWGLTWLHMDDIDPNNITMDMDIVPINANESKFTANVDIWDLWFRGWVGVGVPCYVQSHVAGHVTVSGVVDVGNPDPTKLAPRILSASVGGLSHWGTYMNVIRPQCNLYYNALTTIFSDLFSLALNGRINDQIRDRIREPLQVNTQSIVGPGVTLAGGGGFQFRFPGFQTTCSYNCAGGSESLDANGLHILVEAGADDLKASNAPRRFPLVYDPVPFPGVSPLGFTTTTPAGAPYDIGVFLHPTLLNQILRSLVEGGPGPNSNGLLDLASSGGFGLEVHPEVAPIFVDQPPIPNQILPAATLFAADLRVDDNLGDRLAVNAAVGIDLTVNAATRKLIPQIQVYVDVDMLECASSVVYAFCANQDWRGGPPSLVPSVPSVINWVVNTVVPPVLSNSLGEIEIPPINGFDPLVLGNVEVRRNGGTLAIYVGT